MSAGAGPAHGDGPLERSIDALPLPSYAPATAGAVPTIASDTFNVLTMKLALAWGGDNRAAKAELVAHINQHVAAAVAEVERESAALRVARDEAREEAAREKARRIIATPAPVSAAPADNRAAFEAWAATAGHPLKTNMPSGDYDSWGTSVAWDAFHAGRASLPSAGAPVTCPGCNGMATYIGQHDGYDDADCHMCDGKGKVSAGAPVSAADQFCDANCTWRDHAPGCERAEAAPVSGAEQAPFKPTEQQYAEWCERHDLPPHLGREAFDDATSLYLEAVSPADVRELPALEFPHPRAVWNGKELEWEFGEAENPVCLYTTDQLINHAVASVRAALVTARSAT